MSEPMSCPDCGAEIESMDDLERGESVTEMAEDEDGSVTLFENHDLFLCKGCKKPLGMSRS